MMTRRRKVVASIREEIVAGQVWADTNQRRPGRKVRVTEVKGGYVHLQTINKNGNPGTRSVVRMDVLRDKFNFEQHAPKEEPCSLKP